MRQSVIDLWADISSESYWNDLVESNSCVFVPLDERWPQPGFIGSRYFDQTTKVVVLGQNPRASNTARASDADMEMFRLIRDHSVTRSADSIAELFSMMRSFMLGIDYKPAWIPITAVRRDLGLHLDNIGFLNLIPLATYGDRIVPAFGDAYEASTMIQLRSLNPDKIVVFGKGAYEKFAELGGTSEYETRYLNRRKYKKDAHSVKRWLNS